MDGVKVLKRLRSGRSVTVCGTWKPSVAPIVKLRLVPDFVTGTQILWSIGVYHDRKCVRRFPALSTPELEDRLYDLKICDEG